VADLVFKFTALLAALAAANFFYFQPTVRLRTSAQAFIDPSALSESYAKAGHPMPEVLEDIIQTYNSDNLRDLETGHNSTARKKPLPAELCARMRKTVEGVFPEADCSASSVVIGRGRYYERLLLGRNRASPHPLSVAGLREAIQRLRFAEYRRARTRMKNIGNAKATNVRIRISDGFVPRLNQANDPFSLDSGQEFRRDFETARRDFEEHPRLEFGVDWDRAGLGGAGPAIWVATFMLAALLFVVVNDILRSSREGPAADSSRGRG
jgi:Flp pilus assembly protein TadB